MPDFSSALALLTSPAILFFFIGAGAALARSDLTIPEPVAKALSLYLMFCIGFKGGVEARAAGLNGDFIAAGVIGVALSALMPLVAFIILKRTSRLDRPTLCALAATYGSVSVVTFAAGQQHLEAVGLPAGGYMAAVLALMETPAILTALLLLNGAGRGEPGRRRTILKEVFVGAAMVMLLGSFLVGVVSGNAGMARLELFVGPLFQGALCFFLLDIANLHATCSALGGDPRDQLDRMPLDHVAYIHVAGGFTDPSGVYWDTHAHDMTDDVLWLLSHVVDVLGPHGPPVLLERDTDVDALILRTELDRVRRAASPTVAPT